MLSRVSAAAAAGRRTRNEYKSHVVTNLSSPTTINEFPRLRHFFLFSPGKENFGVAYITSYLIADCSIGLVDHQRERVAME